MKRLFAFAAILFIAAGTVQADVTGTWQGRLEVGPATLRVVFNITREDNQLSATFDSPDQGVYGTPVTRVEYARDRLTLEIGSIGGVFAGRLADDRLTGEWAQAGQAFPLKLVRADETAEPRRPQDPVPPYPYRSEEVSFPGPVGPIAGTLTFPDQPGPFPAMLLLSGSGQRDRDQEMFGHRPFLVLADYLTRRGFAVLRCDDRGVGGSTGDPTLATTEDFALDARAALAWLRARPETDADRTGVIGHSEGALIGGMLAAREDSPAFLVMLGGPGVPGEELLLLQGKLLLHAAGISEPAVAANSRLQELIFRKVRRDLPPDVREAEMRKAIEAELEQLEPGIRTELDLDSPQTVAAQAWMAATPWLRFFLDYDPTEDLRRVTAPTLVLCGSLDLQVPPDLNLPAIEAALETGGTPDYTILVLPGLNHMFQTAETGHMQEYGLLEETLAPLALDAIGDWLEARLQEN